MDYDNPQFIAAVKRVLHDGLAHLSNSFNDLKDAVSAHWQSDEKRYQTKPITVADLRTDVPIPIEDKTKKTKPERIWAIFKGTVESVGILAAIWYAFTAYGQLQELITANSVAMSSYHRARIDGNEQGKLSQKQLASLENQFRLQERALIAVARINAPNGELMDAGLVKPSLGNPPAYRLQGINIGKSVAIDLRVYSGIELTAKGTDPKLDMGNDQVGMQLLGLTPPGATFEFWSTRVEHWAHKPKGFTVDVPYLQNEITDVDSGQKIAFVYGRVTYRDIFRRQHWLNFCHPAFPPSVPDRIRRDLNPAKCAEFNTDDTN